MSPHTDKLALAATKARARMDKAWLDYEAASREWKAAENDYWRAKDLEQHGAPLPRVTMAQAAAETVS